MKQASTDHGAGKRLTDCDKGYPGRPHGRGLPSHYGPALAKLSGSSGRSRSRRVWNSDHPFRYVVVIHTHCRLHRHRLSDRMHDWGGSHGFA